MRPIKLTMQAFGAFKDKIEIDFSILGKSNIYLISGATGSGKTTIFDAICYALFNSSSGSNRSGQSPRSHFAPDDVQTFVELEFEFNNQIYKIYRCPSYERKKLRGKGLTKVEANAILYLPDGKIIEKSAEVDEFLPKLLGLNLSQFSQIALLAQGEFLKLLNCDTKTRGEIFRNIFKTWNYLDFQESLKNKSNELKNKYNALNESIIQYIGDIQATNELLLELKEKYINLKSFNNLDEFLELLQTQTNNDEISLKNIRKVISKIENEIKLLQETTRNINIKKDIANQISLLLFNLETLEKEFIEIDKNYKNIELFKNELKEYNIQLKKTQDDYDKVVSIEKINQLILQLEKDLTDKKSQNDSLNNDLNVIKNDYLKTLFSKYLNTQEELKELQELFLQKQKQVAELSDNYIKNYNEYLKIQAGIIAQTLEEGKPCPVCGSISHPEIAINENKELTKEFLDEIKKQVDIENENLQKLSSNCSLFVEKLKHQKEEYDKNKIRFNIEIHEEKYQILDINFEDELIKIQENINNTEKNINEIQAEIQANKAKIDTLIKDINFKDITQIQLNHDDLNKKILLKEKEIKDIEQKYLSFNLELSDKKSKIELLNKQYEQLKDIDILKLDEICVVIEKYLKEIQDYNIQVEEILVRIKVNERIYDSLKNQNIQYNIVSKKYIDYKILAECANGSLTGKVRIPFEQYIQGYYLDLVLNEANKRLKIMTQGQFQLLRKTQDIAHNAKSGLELEVMDYHTFKRRSTKTLSGGESFKAALALALGLSDCISNFSGAINIDAMFIDEGFGSLDSDSLELALDVIFNLSLNNRIIGIISHIDDLKTKIQNQILTYKTHDGSKIEVKF